MKRALVLCGGGSLGSYEIGAWRFLREKGMDFDIVTGTSIGAINGALVVSGEFEKAETLWKSVDASRVINNGINFYDRMWESFTKANFSRLMALAKDYVKFGGFDISPLIDLMNQAIDPKKVLNSKTAFAVTTSTFPGFKQHNVDMKRVPEKEVMQWLLASSACYPIFPAAPSTRNATSTEGITTTSRSTSLSKWGPTRSSRSCSTPSQRCLSTPN
jgi:Predicted esterase of the alpha-beta hydrolase superfamily